jgi:hypothetical protein
MLFNNEDINLTPNPKLFVEFTIIFNSNLLFGSILPLTSVILLICGVTIKYYVCRQGLCLLVVYQMFHLVSFTR